MPTLSEARMQLEEERKKLSQYRQQQVSYEPPKGRFTLETARQKKAFEQYQIQRGASIISREKELSEYETQIGQAEKQSYYQSPQYHEWAYKEAERLLRAGAPVSFAGDPIIKQYYYQIQEGLPKSYYIAPSGQIFVEKLESPKSDIMPAEIPSAMPSGLKPSGAMLGLPAEGRKALRKEEIMGIGQKAVSEIKGFGTGVIFPLAYLSKLGEKSPLETGAEVGKGFAGAFSMLGIQTKKPEQTFQIERFGSGELGAEVGILAPSIAISAISMRDPKMEISVTKATVKRAGMKEIPIQARQGEIITAKGEGFEGLAVTKVRYDYPLRKSYTQRIDTTFEYGIVSAGKGGRFVTQAGPIEVIKSGKSYLVVGKGMTETYMGKGLIEQPFLIKEIALKLPRELISYGAAVGKESSLASLASAKKLSQGKYGVVGAGFIPGSKEAFPMYQEVKIISSKMAGAEFFKGIKPSSIKTNIPTVTLTQTMPPTDIASGIAYVSPKTTSISAGPAVSRYYGMPEYSFAAATPSGVAASAAGGIITKGVFSTQVTAFPYLSIGIPGFKQGERAVSAFKFMPVTGQITPQKTSAVTKQIPMQQEIQIQKQIVSPMQIQPQIMPEITPLKPIQPVIPKEIFPARGAFISPVNVLPPFYPAGFRLGFGKARGVSIFGKQPSRYTPSLAARAFRIKSPSIPRFSMTGIARRPLIRKRRKK